MKEKNGRFVYGKILDKNFGIIRHNALGLYWNGGIYILSIERPMSICKTIPTKFIKRYIFYAGVYYPTAKTFISDIILDWEFREYFPKIPDVPKFIKTLEQIDHIRDDFKGEYFKITII